MAELTMAHQIKTWIAEAAGRLQVPIERLEPEAAYVVAKEARARFVMGDPRVWWLSLAQPCEQYDSRAARLRDVIPEATGMCWFIPEKGDQELPVFSIDVSTIDALLDECPFFEYYVVSKTLDWLLIESDHNVYFVCRSRGRRS